jgi:hypothetical protein
VEWRMQIRAITWETTKNDKHLTRRILFNNIGYPTTKQVWEGLAKRIISAIVFSTKGVMCLRNGQAPVLVSKYYNDLNRERRKL